MKTIEKRDYMQSAIDMNSRTYYDDMEKAYNVAKAEFLEDDGTVENLTGVGASAVMRDGEYYFRIEFYSDGYFDMDNMATVVEDDHETAAGYYNSFDAWAYVGISEIESNAE